jgi:hypothetical protein
MFGPIYNIPEELIRGFTLDGRVPITIQFRYETSNGSLAWDRDYWEHLLLKVDNLLMHNEILGYSSDVNLVEMLKKFDIKGKDVVVIGSVHPLYEALVYRLGAKPSTVEFRKISHNIPFLKTFTVDEIDSSNIEFDCGLTISALEHDGLGRYGDPIDPDGDLKTMIKYKKLIKKGGLMFLSVPVGQDALVWNSHRIYGKHRLPRLFENWSLVGMSGFDDSLFEYGQLGIDYKEPVFVLQNI